MHKHVARRLASGAAVDCKSSGLAAVVPVVVTSKPLLAGPTLVGGSVPRTAGRLRTGPEAIH